MSECHWAVDEGITKRLIGVTTRIRKVVRVQEPNINVDLITVELIFF